jgi:hypothetical protein
MALPGTQFTCFARYLVLSLLALRVLNLLALLASRVLNLLALLRGEEAQRLALRVLNLLSLLALRVLNLLALLRGGEARRQRLVSLPGTQFTRFTGTKKVLNYVRAHATRASKGGLLKLLQRFFFLTIIITAT